MRSGRRVAIGSRLRASGDSAAMRSRMGAPRAEVAIVVALALAALPASAAPGPNSAAAGPNRAAASGAGAAGLEPGERRIAARPSAARAAAGHAPALACD